MQFNTSRGPNNISPPGEQSSEEASAQAREAAPEPYPSGQKKTGLLSNYTSPPSYQGAPNSAKQQEPPAASWAIRDDAPPAASWAIRDDAPPAASWAYVDERATSITPELPAERFTDPFMRRDEAHDILSGRVSPHESAIAHSPFGPNRSGAPGPMQPPQQPAPRPANYVQAPPPAQQRPAGQPMTPPSPAWPAQQPANFVPAQMPRPMQGPPGRNGGPPPAGYRGNPAPAGWQQQQGPMVLSNRAVGYVNGPPPSMYNARAGKAARKKKRFPVWASVLAATLVVTIAVGGYFAMPYINIVSSSTGQKATQFGAMTGKNKGNTMQTTNNDSGPVLSGKRTNILLLGSDTDTKTEFAGAYLAQTDIVVTIDPGTKYVGICSIPRDLQVNIPGYGAGKLDAAFSYGYQSKKSSNPIADGAGLAIATIEQNFGIPIDQYAWVGLDGFIKVINTAGGVDVDVTHPMVDDTYPDDINATTGSKVNQQQAYGVKRLYIAPGPQHLDGVQALEYVRTRHSDLVGDFGRSVRQQQVLDQLKVKLETPDIIAKLPELTTDLNGYVKTSMNLNDLASLGNFARTINTGSIDRLVLGPPYSTSMKNNTNFAPVCDKIIPAIQKMFGLGANEATCIPQTSANTAGVASSRIPSGATTNQDTIAASRTNAAEASAQAMSQLARMSMLNIGNAHSDPVGVQYLLNLMLMVALESFEAMATT